MNITTIGTVTGRQLNSGDKVLCLNSGDIGRVESVFSDREGSSIPVLWMGVADTFNGRAAPALLIHSDDAAHVIARVTGSRRDAPKEFKQLLETWVSQMYFVYCREVGGVAYDGNPLPDWETFKNDPAKKKQCHAWYAMGKAALLLAFAPPESLQTESTENQ